MQDGGKGGGLLVVKRIERVRRIDTDLFTTGNTEDTKSIEQETGELLDCRSVACRVWVLLLFAKPLLFRCSFLAN